MKRFQLIICLIIAVLIVITVQNGISQQQTDNQDSEFKWYKGNTHCHTLNSDGDSTPDDVVRWYREHKYNFLVITDHNFLTNIDGLNQVYGAKDKFIVLKGIEVTDQYGTKPVHINCLNPKVSVLPGGGTNVMETIQNNVELIRNAGAVPHINHPNYKWAITNDELKKVNNCNLIEIFNGHPRNNLYGGGGLPGVEEMWDDVLSGGKLFYGMATDDAHNFKEPWNKNVGHPGSGWIMVRAKSLTPEVIINALEKGDFYASTGVELTDYQVSEKEIKIQMKKGNEYNKFTVQFIGKGGKIFKTDFSNPATYKITGTEMYIRAKVIDSDGKVAWTQPYMINKNN